QIVNNFFNCFVATAGVQLRVRQGFATTSTAPLPFFPRALFPLARKRRDSMHPPPIAQEVSRKNSRPRTLPRAGP
ncbi:hypothetical protein, partial [Burkholderia sp. WTPI3]|uniref:hypothetical protein n=1 Tax=Burkholderia sp. WTPI3 TaxID=2822167 RepID=UPI001F32797A